MYTFGINEYRAIKKANIAIDGISVLAGVNGSGKSTLARWLYYIINATHSFEQYQRSYFIQSLEQEIEKVHRVFRSSPRSLDYQSIKASIRRFRQNEELEWDILKQTYFSFVEKAEVDLSDYAKTNPLNGRLSNFLLGKNLPEETNNRQIIDTYILECYDTYEKGFLTFRQKVESCKRDDLGDVISSEFSKGEQLPDMITLAEGETDLLRNETFSPPLMLNRAIYIDSPMAVSSKSFYLFSRNAWDELQYYLYNENPQKKSLFSDQLRIEIQSVIGGDIQLVEDKFGIDRELHYVSKKQGIDISISDAATGIKTFAYMMQLLNNGWLDKETLLLIDEPEAHLHPQWIVEFARLLVRIHKALGVKVLIASHNPDMIAAIQAIALKEGVIKDTVFYLTHREKDDLRYAFVDKGSDISDIFTSFNIAISRIEMYGSSMI